jgi:hypothetical protein
MQSILGQAAARTGMSYSLYEQEEDFMLVESAIPVAADTVAVTISFFNRNLLLRTSPTGGWMKISVEQQDAEALTAPKPLWEAPLMALGVLCAVALGAAMLAMLVQKHLHQTLLQVSDLFGANRTTGRQRIALELRTAPRISRRTCSPRHGLQSRERDWAEVTKRQGLGLRGSGGCVPYRHSPALLALCRACFPSRRYLSWSAVATFVSASTP